MRSQSAGIDQLYRHQRPRTGTSHRSAQPDVDEAQLRLEDARHEVFVVADEDRLNHAAHAHIEAEALNRRQIAVNPAAAS